MDLKLWRLLPVRAAASSADIAGAVDGFIDGAWQGWAMDRRAPGRSLNVTLITGVGRRIHTDADRYRADVHRVMPGHGYYGFRVSEHWLGGETLSRVLVGETLLPMRGRPERAR
jgi:hypothetical protein